MARVVGVWAAVLGAWVMERAWAVVAERVVGLVRVAMPRTLCKSSTHKTAPKKHAQLTET